MNENTLNQYEITKKIGAGGMGCIGCGFLLK